MSTPRLLINIEELKYNYSKLQNIGAKRNVTIACVTKSFGADPKLVQALYDAGCRAFCDSRLTNFKRYTQLELTDITRILIRMPAKSEIKEVVSYSDISCNSEKETLRLLNQEALRQNKKHGVILMVELGDRREGLFPQDIVPLVNTILHEYKGLEFKGIGTNHACLGAIIPDIDKMQQLLSVANTVEKRCTIPCEIISGGNSANVYMLLDESLPIGITQLRVGECLLRGNDVNTGQLFPNLKHNLCRLEAEVIERIDKPSLSEGKMGLNAFGKQLERPKDRGIIRRCLVALGKQDFGMGDITPAEPHFAVLGSSSDHTLVELLPGSPELKVGDKVLFNVNYGAINSAFLTDLVEKVYVKKSCS